MNEKQGEMWHAANVAFTDDQRKTFNEWRWPTEMVGQLGVGPNKRIVAKSRLKGRATVSVDSNDLVIQAE